MNLTLQGFAPYQNKAVAPAHLGIVQLSLLLVSLGSLYYSILPGLAAQWWRDPNYSHGFLLPLFCVWVVRRRRDQLRNIRPTRDRSGLLVICAGLGILALGVLGAEDFLSRSSLLIVLGGLVVQFRGWRYFRVLLFPWGVLFLTIPLPAIILNEISLPLQFLASYLGSSLLTGVGVPVLREGNIIQMSTLTLDVAEACSGLRSLITLIAIATIYGYLKEPRVVHRMWIVFSAIPVAIAVNGLRIMVSGVIGQYWSPELAEGFFHTLSGVVLFALALLLLVLVDAALSRTEHFLHSRWTA